MKKIGFLVIVAIWAGVLVAHQGREHTKPDTPISLLPAPEMDAQINLDYVNQIRPIWEKKCFACHAKNQELPWYAVIPGIRQIILWDIWKAQEHLDLSDNFPFGGHGSPAEDLEAILEMLAQSNMPPLRYQIFHWDSGLTPNEKAQVHRWALDSLLSIKPEFQETH